jgi:hypothetical protein
MLAPDVAQVILTLTVLPVNVPPSGLKTGSLTWFGVGLQHSSKVKCLDTNLFFSLFLCLF